MERQKYKDNSDFSCRLFLEVTGKPYFAVSKLKIKNQSFQNVIKKKLKWKIN